MANGGGTVLLASQGHVRGPGHNALLQDGQRDWLVHHFYDATVNGVATLQIRPLTWSADGWPAAGPPLDAPLGTRSIASAQERGDRQPESTPPTAGKCYVWEWRVRGKEPFKLWLHPNGLVSRNPEPATNPSFSWARSGRTITVYWPQGWIDTMEIQAGDNVMSGQNQHGAEIKAHLVRTILEPQ